MSTQKAVQESNGDSQHVCSKLSESFPACEDSALQGSEAQEDEGSAARTRVFQWQLRRNDPRAVIVSVCPSSSSPTPSSSSSQRTSLPQLLPCDTSDSSPSPPPPSHSPLRRRSRPRPPTPPPHLADPSTTTTTTPAPSRPPPLAVAASSSAFSQLSPPSSPVSSSPRSPSYVVSLNLECVSTPVVAPPRRSPSVVSAPEALCFPPSSPSPSPPPPTRRSPSPSSALPPSRSLPPSPIPSPPPSPPPPPTPTTTTTTIIISTSPPSPSASRSPSPPPLPSSTPSRKSRIGFKFTRSGSVRLPRKGELQSPLVFLRRSAPSCPNTPTGSPPPLDTAISSPEHRRSSLPQGTEPLTIAERFAERKSELVLQCSRINNVVKWGAKVGINSTLRRTWSSVKAGRIEEDRSGVSEYLMGDIDSSSAVLNCSTASSRNKSYENLMSSDAESSAGEPRGGSGVEAGDTGSGVLDTSLKEPEVLTPQQIDEQLHRHEQGVEHALYRAKVWSKYAKDVIAYIEKRAQLDLDHCRALTKLAHVTRPALKDESFLPFQSIYCTALDQDIENCTQISQTSTLLLTHKFVEPLTTRRNEHDRTRKGIKETWTKELKRVTEALSNLKKAKMGYDQRHQELGRAREALARAENPETQDKLERKRDEALQKAKEAEGWYKQCVSEANERHASLLRVKREVLVQLRELILQCDQTMKAVTVGYFQLQHTVAAPAPVQFQTLCESSRLYEPGSQYMEFVKRLGPSPGPDQPESPFSFQPYRPGAPLLSSHHDPSANGAVPPHDDLQVGRLVGPGGSDTDSVGSSAKSMEGSPTASPLPPPRRPHTVSSGDELETDPDTDTHYPYPARRPVMSKAAISHSFRKLLTPSRCRECDSYVYFHGYECTECGLGCHKKCLETLAIKCGHKRLPRKMTTFGVDLAQHLTETNTTVPHLVVKCVAEIDGRGTKIKGIYRVSGVKSRVEKLCQAFENGAHLVDLSDQHPNVIANVLKLYLRQLPEPLLTFRLYPDFIRIAKEWGAGTGAEGAGRAGEELRELVGRLPRHHLACLASLMHHLHRVAAHAQQNNMPPSNLGIVFGPTLLRTAEGSASLSSLVDTVHQTRAIELLIMCVNEIFGPQDPLQAATGVSRRAEEQQKPPQGRHACASVSSSSSSSGSVVYTVPIAGYRRSTTDAEDSHAGASLALKDRKDSEVQDDDWDSEGWEESAFESVAVAGGDASSATHPTTTTTTTMSSSSTSIASAAAAAVSPSPVPPPRASPASSRAPPAQAKIYKTSLRDYVGLEGVALHVSSGLHSAHEVHQKLRKTVSDISSSLRSSSPATAAITTITTTTTSAIPSSAATTTTSTTVLIPSPSVHDMPRRGSAVEDVKKLVVAAGTAGTGGGGGGSQEDKRSQDTPLRKAPQQEEATRRKPPPLEETGRRPTIEEAPRKAEEAAGARRPEQEASRVLQQPPRPQVYKSESKGSVSEAELKVEARVGVVGGSGQETVVVSPPRKVSPLLGQRAALAQHSGTDSSLDSDHSYDYHSHSHTPAAPSVPTHRRAEVGYSATTRSFSTSRDASLDNLTSSVTSSDSSSQELDSAHATEDSHSSEAPDDPHALTHAPTYTSGCGGSSGGESGYVSPYLGGGSVPGPVVVGPSVLLTRATIAQYDKRRTITTVLAPRTSFDENRVRIQVPPAPAGGGRTPGTGSLVTVGVEEGATVSVSASPTSPRSSTQEPSSPPARLLQLQPQSPGPPMVFSSSPTTTPSPRPLANQPDHPRRPSPNRSPRFV